MATKIQCLYLIIISYRSPAALAQSWEAKGAVQRAAPKAAVNGAAAVGAQSPEAFLLISANLRAKILDFRGFDSSMILNLSVGILMSKENSLEILSQQILVWIILVGRLGVVCAAALKQ